MNSRPVYRYLSLGERIAIFTLLALIIGRFLSVGLMEVRQNWNSSTYDQRSYLRLGLKIRDRKAFTDGNRHPLYPALISLFAEREWAYFTKSKLLSLTIGGMALVTIFALSRRLYNDDVALLATFLFSINQEFIRESSRATCESLFVLLFFISCQGAHQLANLRDYDDFHRYVQDHFHLAGRVVYDYRLLEVYHLDELMPSPLDINFGDRIMLTGLAWGDGPMDLIDPSRSVGLHGIEAGGELVVTLRWRSLTHMEEDYYLVLRLIDEEGKLWGLGQRQLMDIETETYWDDKGLERAVQFPTSQWPVGEVVLDYYKLPVFPGTPPGRYQIIARLRPLDTWEGLEVLSQDVAPYGFDYPLGMLEVTRPSVPPAIAQLAIPHLFTEELGNEVQLLGYELAATEVKSGETLHLSFFWQALRQMDKDYYLLLQVRDAEGNVWAEEEFPLASKGYPTTRWVKDEMLRGQYAPLIDAEAPSGKYQLLLNLVDRASGNKVLSEDLVFAELAIAGRKRQFAVPKAIQYPMQANFGHCVTFLGYDLAETKIKPGRTLHLTLYWQAQMEMKTSYKVFTHILDREEQIWGQRDSIPVGGTYPTTGWLPGEVTIDEYEISVKPNAPAGEYRIEVGMYDAVTGKRLPVFDEEGKRIPQDRVLLNSRVRVAR